MDRYEEALGRARKLREGFEGYNANVAIIEEIFPELAESEDERIRKAILQKVLEASEDGCETFGGVEIDEVLTYLEKQKEPNIELIQRSWYMDGYIDGEFKREPKWIIKTGKGGPKHEVNPNYGKLLEQKPAEFNDDDDQLIGFIFDLLNDLVWRKDWAMSKEECLKRLKSLRPQPKEENVGKELLYVAEKQYERGKRDGYREGFDEGYKKANEAMSFHYDMFHNSTPCYAPRGVCTNPQMDCINCPKKTTGGSFTITTKSDEK